MTHPVSKFWHGFDEQFRSGAFIKDKPEIHQLSTCSVMLDMCFGDQLLAKGTGWFWRLPDGIALVTAWHNLAGLHHTTRKTLSSHGGVPDRIRYRYMTSSPRTFQDAEIPLFFDDDREQPRWFVHPTCGSYLDMAFIGLSINGAEVTCINDSVQTVHASTRPGSDVFAVGFPQGIRMIGVFPIWKRGSVASDPDLPVEGHPKFYVDMAGRGGLSGAPVYSVRPGGQTEFMGLYSGRAADQLPPNSRSGESTDLGFVWRATFLVEMLNSGVLDERPEIGKGAVTMNDTWRKADAT